VDLHQLEIRFSVWASKASFVGIGYRMSATELRLINGHSS
jgi:hypothetical protein